MVVGRADDASSNSTRRLQMAPRQAAAQQVRDRIPVSDKIAVGMTVNGVERRLNIAPWTTLLDALRDHLDLTGTKKGCDHGQCGA
jgi:xanthine dehydrogenase YagT iron-sulfur-binding subunit